MECLYPDLHPNISHTPYNSASRPVRGRAEHSKKAHGDTRRRRRAEIQMPPLGSLRHFQGQVRTAQHGPRRGRIRKAHTAGGA